MTDYEYTGSLPLNLDDGRTLKPGSGRFAASFTPGYESFLLRAGIVRKAPKAAPPQEETLEAAPAAKRK